MPDMKKTEKPQKTPRRKRRAPYATKPYTPQAKQIAVEALAISGANDSQIAEQVGLDRETVRRLLSRSEMETMRGIGRSIILEAVPNLATLLVEIAKTKNLEAILAALRGVGALSTKLEVENSMAKEERTYSFRALLMRRSNSGRFSFVPLMPMSTYSPARCCQPRRSTYSLSSRVCMALSCP
jgi:transposase-like protein